MLFRDKRSYIFFFLFLLVLIHLAEMGFDDTQKLGVRFQDVDKSIDVEYAQSRYLSVKSTWDCLLYYKN